MSDEEDYYDLYGENIKETKPTNNFIALDNLIEENKVSTEQYLNDTIGDVISELLEECAQQSPPDPIVYLAELLEKKYRDIYETPTKPQQKSGRKKRTSSTVFQTAATIAHNVVNIKNNAAAKNQAESKDKHQNKPSAGSSSNESKSLNKSARGSKPEAESKEKDQSKHSVASKGRRSKSPSKSAESRPDVDVEAVKAASASKKNESQKNPEGKPNGSSISHNVAASNSKQPRKHASSTSGLSSTNVSRTSTSSKSSDYTDMETSSSQSRFKITL